MVAKRVKVETEPKKAIDPVEIVEEIKAIQAGKPWYTSKTLYAAAAAVLTAVATGFGFLTAEQCIALGGAITALSVAFLRLNPTTPITK